MPDQVSVTWPWYVAGPLIGLMVPALLLAGNRLFGFSSNFRHLCTAVLPTRAEYFRYDWRTVGGWNLAFLAGTLLGGFLVAQFLGPVGSNVSPATHDALTGLGVASTTGLVPTSLFSWPALLTLRGLLVVVGGGFLVGFGTAYAGGCTSGHAISGLAAMEKASLIAVIGFFAGGLIGTHLLLPALLPVAP